MIDMQKEIELRLSVLRGLELSGVNHAADMLTMGFGSLRPVTNFKGKVKYVGEWALHVQCAWRLERASTGVATRDDLCGPDEKANATASRLQEILIERGPFIVESLAADEVGGIVLTLSGDLRLVVIPDGNKGEEDWRFFSHDSDKHLVIEGGMIDPDSLS